MNRVVGHRSSVVGAEAIGRWPLAVGHLLHAAHFILREIFDENAWERFSARHKTGKFSDFLRDRHGRPRQRCC